MPLSLFLSLPLSLSILLHHCLHAARRPLSGIDGYEARACTRREFTRLRGVSHADALISPRFIPISRSDKSICHGEPRDPRGGSRERVLSRGAAPRKFFHRAAFVSASRGYFKFHKAGRVQARVSIFQRQPALCDGRRIPEVCARFEAELLHARRGFSTILPARIPNFLASFHRIRP